jgi:hypothetical protein
VSLLYGRNLHLPVPQLGDTIETIWSTYLHVIED